MKKHQGTRTRSEAQVLKCTYCPKSFRTPFHLRQHLRIHTGEKPFMCEFCPKQFSLCVNLKRHLRVHTGEKPFVCEFCPKRFSQRVNLKRHLRVHTGEKPFLCEFCHKQFSVHGNLKTHLRVHTGEKPFVCEFCPKQFSVHWNLKRHLRVHTGEKPFLCEFCHKQFNRRAHLKTHLRVHTGEKPFVCEFCPKQFYQSVHLKTHLRVHTREKPYKCKLCHKQFAYRSNCNRHFKESHTKAQSSESCKTLEVLNTTATTETGTDEDEIVLPRTMAKASEVNETPTLSATDHKCEYCSKVCKSASGLLRHRKSHIHKRELSDQVFRDTSNFQDRFPEYHPDQEKLSQLETATKSSSTEYQCEHCSKVCKSAAGLVSHQKSHFAHKCRFCDKVFCDTDTLQHHTSEIHPEQLQTFSSIFPTDFAHMESSDTSPPKYMCQWCGRSFTKYYLPEHYRIHQQIPHECEFCGKIFTAPSYLKRHIRRCH